MFTALIAALENPATDAAIIEAGAGLVKWFRSLAEENQKKVAAQIDAMIDTSTAQLAAADQDLADAEATIAALQEQQTQADAQRDEQHRKLTATVVQLNDEHAALWPRLNVPQNMPSLKPLIDAINAQVAALVAPLK